MSLPTNKNAFAVFAALLSRTGCARLLACGLLGLAIGALTIAGPPRGRKAHADAGLTAHEWGTFTAIAGTDGQPVEWLPVDLVGGAHDLPHFVQHFRTAGYKDVLRGTVRMETPVIYFYSAHAATVSVHVSFAKGFITEWYPHTTRIQPSTSLLETALYEDHSDGSITWDSVTVAPNLADDFPRENAGSHYYAARETLATPLSVHTPSGDQHEKFLFYRGVSNVSLPVSAKVLPSGSIQFDNRTGQPIPALILFERRGDKLGYHVVTSARDRITLEIPSVSGTFGSLRSDLEDLLVAQGLFRDEAHAMLETWRDSWFEEGSRLFYIVPRAYVDSILPLSINPAPAQLVRTFVGRIELVTPATERSIETAIASHDGASLRKYGRFLYPIFDVMLANRPNQDADNDLLDALGVALATSTPTSP
jgi:hypothetical protein